MNITSKDSRHIKLSDRRTLGYAEYGDPKGKPLLYFHGWPDSRLRIRKVDRAAREVKVRLIPIDRPGFGLSDYKENRTLLDWPDDVTELANKLKLKKFAIVGVSGGGPYTAVTAYKIPKRITRAGIVVGLGPTYIPNMLDDMSILPRLGWANYSKYPIIAKLGSLYRLYAAKYSVGLLSKIDFNHTSDQQVLKEIMADWSKLNNEAFRQGPKGAEKDLLLYTRNWGFEINKIKTNVYLWYGEKDRNVTLAMARYYRDQIKGSRLTIYPNEGHLVSITHAKEIFKTLVS